MSNNGTTLELYSMHAVALPVSLTASIVGLLDKSETRATRCNFPQQKRKATSRSEFFPSVLGWLPLLGHVVLLSFWPATTILGRACQSLMFDLPLHSLAERKEVQSDVCRSCGASHRSKRTMLYPGGLAVRATMEAKAQLSWLSFLLGPFFGPRENTEQKAPAAKEADAAAAGALGLCNNTQCFTDQRDFAAAMASGTRWMRVRVHVCEILSCAGR